jgi:branched-chain amino acid transport system permease protein
MSSRRGCCWRPGAGLPLVTAGSPYTLVLMIDLLIAALFAASLHFIMGPAACIRSATPRTSAWAPMARRCWCARAACRWRALVLAPLVAGIGALVFGWFCVRLSGVYLAMLTLAFAQITWAVVFQWDAFTGGSNGLTGVWPAEWLADKRSYYYLTLALVAGSVSGGCAARCSRPSATRCAPAAIRCCAPTPSAST